MVHNELLGLQRVGLSVEEKYEIKVGTWGSNPGPLHFSLARLPTELCDSFVYTIKNNYYIMKTKCLDLKHAKFKSPNQGVPRIHLLPPNRRFR